MVTISDVKQAVHDGICSCGERVSPRTGEECVDAAQEAIERSVIVTLINKGILKYVTVNDEGNCKHLLSGCCWICGEVGDHQVVSFMHAPCPTEYTRMDIIERLDGRGFRD